MRTKDQRDACAVNKKMETKLCCPGQNRLKLGFFNLNHFLVLFQSKSSAAAGFRSRSPFRFRYRRPCRHRRRHRRRHRCQTQPLKKVSSGQFSRSLVRLWVKPTGRWPSRRQRRQLPRRGRLRTASTKTTTRKSATTVTASTSTMTTAARVKKPLMDLSSENKNVQRCLSFSIR